jgi:hypothetical protein
MYKWTSQYKLPTTLYKKETHKGILGILIYVF